jgi:hypothetical protein
MTTYTWVIQNLPSYASIDGQSDVVFEVNWSCCATTPTSVVGDVYTPSYSAVYSGNTAVAYVAGQPFTPYGQLTQEQVWGWVNPTIDKTTIEANLQALIDTQKNPPIVTPPLPWSN